MLHENKKDKAADQEVEIDASSGGHTEAAIEAQPKAKELPQVAQEIAGPQQVQEATAAQPGGSNPEEDVATAKAFLDLRAELRRQIVATSRVEDTEYDAFGGARNRLAGDAPKGERQAAKAISNDWPGGVGATDKQLGLLRRLGVQQANDLDLTKWRASCLIQLIRESKFSPESALACSKKQALAVLAKLKREAV